MRGVVALALVSVLGMASTCSPSAVAAATLTLETTIPLPNVAGRIDHLAIDLTRGHLFVAELGNNSVDVVDLATSKVIHRVDGLSEPQGVEYVPHVDAIVVAGGGDGAVSFFSGADFSSQGTVSLGEDADNVHLDPRTGTVVVGYGNGGLAILDPARRVKIGDVPLPDHPEGFQISADRIYVNVPGAGEIAVADPAKGEVVAHWPMSLTSNFPMAIDPESHSVAVVFRGSSTLALFDGDAGSPIAQIGTCGDADDAGPIVLHHPDHGGEAPVCTLQALDDVRVGCSASCRIVSWGRIVNSNSSFAVVACPITARDAGRRAGRRWS